jgi:hypothetical protein
MPTDLTRPRAELIAENALLRQQLLILRRQVHHPACTRKDWLLLVLLARATQHWQQALVIVQPDTLLKWHRHLFRWFWRQRSQAASRKPKGAAETACARLEPFRAGSGRFRLEEDVRLSMLPRLAQAYAERGAIEQAGTLLTNVLTQATAWRRRFTVMEIRRTQGLLALRQERWQEAALALDEALALCQVSTPIYI